MVIYCCLFMLHLAQQPPRKVNILISIDFLSHLTLKGPTTTLVLGTSLSLGSATCFAAFCRARAKCGNRKQKLTSKC